MLLGVADVLAGLRKQFSGTVMFIFQPAEEGAEDRSRPWGAEGMLKDGAFQNPKPDAVFGLHVMPEVAGLLGWHKGGTTASADTLHIRVHGQQTHGAMPWMGKDPVTVAGEIVVALQTIPSRQMNSSRAPTIVSIGSMHGGVRSNVIPDEVTLEGTIRVLDPSQREDFIARIERMARLTAEASGLTAEVVVDRGYGVTVNDPALVQRMIPSLERVSKTEEQQATLAAEDFSYFAAQVPGFFMTLGVNPVGVTAENAPANHSPKFTVDEDALVIGVRAMASVAVDFLNGR
jgi:amidohydrolase